MIQLQINALENLFGSADDTVDFHFIPARQCPDEVTGNDTQYMIEDVEAREY